MQNVSTSKMVQNSNGYKTRDPPQRVLALSGPTLQNITWATIGQGKYDGQCRAQDYRLEWISLENYITCNTVSSKMYTASVPTAVSMVVVN